MLPVSTGIVSTRGVSNPRGGGRTVRRRRNRARRRQRGNNLGPVPAALGNNAGCYPLAPIVYRVATRKSEPVYIGANLWSSLFKMKDHRFSMGEWASPHLPPTNSITMGSIDVHWSRLPGAVAANHLVPCFMEYRFEGCCGGACCADIAHGYRTHQMWGEKTFADGIDHPGVSMKENQSSLAENFLLACTRSKVCPGQTVRVPMPPDVQGQQLGKASEAMSAGIVRILACKDGYYELAFRLWVRGASCSW